MKIIWSSFLVLCLEISFMFCIIFFLHALSLETLVIHKPIYLLKAILFGLFAVWCKRHIIHYLLEKKANKFLFPEAIKIPKVSQDRNNKIMKWIAYFLFMIGFMAGIYPIFSAEDAPLHIFVIFLGIAINILLVNLGLIFLKRTFRISIKKAI